MGNSNNTTNSFSEFVMVPKIMLEEILAGQKEILNLFQDSKVPLKPIDTLADKYIPESKAKEMLGRETTWFWLRRKSGELQSKKMGGSNYYTLKSLEALYRDMNK